MSLFVRTLSTKPLATSVTPRLLTDAIAGRLDAIVAKYRPDDAEPTRQVLARLRVEAEGKEAFGVWRIYWSSDELRYLRMERLVGKSFEQLRRDLFDEMTKREEEATGRVRGVLSTSKEIVTIELEASDASAMAWPVALAAAAAIARAGDGLVRVDGLGWLEPKGKELELVLGEAV
jgi:hypothetical protein